MTCPAPARLRPASLLVAALGLLALTSCQRGTAERAPSTERGRYLVEQVGLCADCHSPRNERGEFVADRWLQGAPIPFQPLIEMPWAPVAPSLHGLQQLTDEQALHFLTSGELPGGRRPRPPMPPYRFSPDDARDVLAYLRQPTRPEPGTPGIAH